MSDRPYLLLTGATGLLGRYVLARLAARAIPVAVLIRAPGRENPRVRLEALWQDALSPNRCQALRPVVWEGDLTADELGLTAEAQAWLARHCGGIVHCAASLSFQTGSDGEPWRSNLEGTRQVLEFARRAGIGRIFHVSTAYVCGRRSGTVRESETDCGQLCGNAYEWSKLLAERHLRAASWLDSLTIFRPSIIVGDSQNGFTSSFHGFYTPLRLGLAYARLAPAAAGQPESQPLFYRLGMQDEDGKNLVPVDWVAEAIAAIIANPSQHGGTYHLTHPEPVPVRLIDQVVADAIAEHVRGDARPPSGAQPGSPTFDALTADFVRQMQVYRAYFRHDPCFDRSQTERVLPQLPVPEMSYERLLQLARFALRANFGWPMRLDAQLPCDVSHHLSRGTWEVATGDPAGTAVVQLEVHGPGGGIWTWERFGEGEGSWRPGLAATPDVRVCLHGATLARLAGGQLPLSEALATAAVAILGAPDQLRTAEHLLERLAGTPAGRSHRAGSAAGLQRLASAEGKE